MSEVDDKELTLKYQACYARLADSKRRFLDAAMKYYELSQAANSCAAAAAVATAAVGTGVLEVPRLMLRSGRRAAHMQLLHFVLPGCLTH